MAYEERARGVIALNGQSVVIDPDGVRWLTAKREAVAKDVAEWNEYSVVAIGNHLIHRINGEITAELTDYEESANAIEGLLAFQIHRGPAMTVQFKDILLKQL